MKRLYHNFAYRCFCSQCRQWLPWLPKEEAKTEPSKEIVLNKFREQLDDFMKGRVDFSLGRFDSHADFW